MALFEESDGEVRSASVHVKLTDAEKAWLVGQVEAGLYTSISHVVRRGVWLLGLQEMVSKSVQESMRVEKVIAEQRATDEAVGIEVEP